MSRKNPIVFQHVSPQERALRSAATGFLRQQVAQDRYRRFTQSLAERYVPPTTVQKHRMKTTQKRVLAAAAKKASA